MFDGELRVTPPLTDEQLSLLPSKRGVFMLAGESDVPIILLTAADIRSRLRSRLAEPLEDVRRKTVDLREITRAIFWKRSDSHFETELAYLEIARVLWPRTFTEMLAWRPAWFVHVDPAAEFPHFLRTRDAGAQAGLYVGPFHDGTSADRFIANVQDAFDLCRHYRCLRQSPHGAPCSYAQMGRCLGPCDGSISMDDYRKVVREAAEYAAGKRDSLRAELEQQMKRVAAELAFERAAAIKLRIERLGELDRPVCANAAPLELFRYVLVQQGSSPRQAKAFIAREGEIAPTGTIDYPLQPEQLAGVLARAAGVMAAAPQRDDAYTWRLGLVASHLISGEARRGVIMRWREDLTAEQLASAIGAAAAHLKLRAPKPRAKRGKAAQAENSPAGGSGAEKASS